ncbi:methylenetetrahydrofolate reductase [NAD(P)H] [Clostridium sp. 19966]|uniref:methylenetetrahydrofolate reductase [NAD(P)H] n=1 Tax=Clostridium sp. 19966 TaxID=2768166 RepID=UPI0028DF3B7A|nr:methylenetetrahydrofolate reductase [NAD(P)H] [Clostridium sp. 19966]MDT8715518.1 methylenetetrahydrofolate reductase [NAD(P)H] [Clostridium sp. 19966]
MLIRDIYKNKKPVISFEIFPPKKDSDISAIYNTLEGLKDMRPDFISVTYGAGGSTRDTTVSIASLVKNKYNIESLAHLTCVELDEKALSSITENLKNNNVENILALRGDLPKDFSHDALNSQKFRHASDITSFIKKSSGFSVGGACYPEGHVECDSLDKDIYNLKLKAESGADFLITQLFFDNEKFYSFMEKIRSIGINIPVSAGIMPVTNKKQIERMVQLSGATLPKKFTRIMEKYEFQPEALKEAGIAYATEQIIDLLSWGIDGIHLYTMNRPETCRKITENIKTIRNSLEENII